jgi:hypothetical protein
VRADEARDAGDEIGRQQCQFSAGAFRVLSFQRCRCSWQRRDGGRSVGREWDLR